MWRHSELRSGKHRGARVTDGGIGTAEPEGFERRSIWLRGLWMLILAVLVRIASVVLAVAALLQFGWMLFAGERNGHIAAFGERFARWMAIATRYLTGQSERLPFPWEPWD